MLLKRTASEHSLNGGSSTSSSPRKKVKTGSASAFAVTSAAMAEVSQENSTANSEEQLDLEYFDAGDEKEEVEEESSNRKPFLVV